MWFGIVKGLSMPALGQSLHLPAFGMSGVHPKATELRTSLDVRNVPKTCREQVQQTVKLFDHPIGTDQERRR
jgi:hypothetical protein